VRSFGKLAVHTAIVGLSVLATCQASAQKASAQQSAGQQSAAHRIAVVDVAKIFKEHPGIREQVKSVESELKAYDGQLKKKREVLQQEAAKLKTFNVGTPDYTAQEEKVASMESKLRLEMQRKRQELAEAEARIYYENYQRIAEGVAYLAKHYNISLVLRYNSEAMDVKKGESVIRGVMKNIVYHDKALDMTTGVMQYLDQTMKVANRPGNTSSK